MTPTRRSCRHDAHASQTVRVAEHPALTGDPRSQSVLMFKEALRATLRSERGRAKADIEIGGAHRASSSLQAREVVGSAREIQVARRFSIHLEMYQVNRSLTPRIMDGGLQTPSVSEY